MKAGDVVRWSFMQGDGQRKFRPAVIVAVVPPFNDLLVCAISTQLHREIKDLDVLLDPKHPDFQRTGLQFPSLIRVAQLTTLPDKVIQGSIGEVSQATIAEIRKRLRNWLV